MPVKSKPVNETVAAAKPKPTTHTLSNVPEAAVIGFGQDELLALARIEIEKGNLADALLKLKQVVANENVPTEAYSITARLYAQLGLWDRAQKMFDKYLELEPKAVTETFQLGMVHFDAGRPADALAIWDNLLKNHPTHPPALFYRALILTKEGHAQQARQALEVLLKSAPADNLYFGRGKELLQGIDANPQSAKPAGGNTSAANPRTTLATDAYKTEH